MASYDNKDFFEEKNGSPTSSAAESVEAGHAYVAYWMADAWAVSNWEVGESPAM